MPTTATKTTAKTLSLGLSLSNPTGGSLATPSVATLTINERVAPELSVAQPPATATTGHPYKYVFAATGEPKPTFSVGSPPSGCASGYSCTLPDGLHLNSTTGELSGKPTAGGLFIFAVKATNGVAPSNTSPPINLTVSQPPKFNADTPPATWGKTYASYVFRATGYPAPTLSRAGTIPPGLSFYAGGCGGTPDLLHGCGYLEGTPTTAGTYKFTVTAANGVNPNAVTSTITIRVPS